MTEMIDRLTSRTCAILCAITMGCIAANAQDNIIGIHPASGESGKHLTMEDVILNRNIYPRSVAFAWAEKAEYIKASADGIQTYNIDGTLSDTDYRSRSAEMYKHIPENGNPAAVGGTNVAYTIGNNLYYVDAEGNSHVIAEDGNPAIVYGQSVSRNEFGINGGVFWAESNKRLAFYRKDESKVSDFPLLDITTRTGSLKNIKYPMAGMDSERISLGVYDLETENTVYLDVQDFGDDRYLTNITWSPDDKYIFVQVLDRSQKHMKLNKYESATGKFVKTILTEDNGKYVEPLDPLYFIKGRNDIFVYKTNNRDGYKNLYLCDTTGVVRRLTGVDADVEYIGNDGVNVYYTSAEVSPVENHLFRIGVTSKNRKGLGKFVFGKAQRLTPEEGWHDIAINSDCTYFIDRYSSLNVPGTYKLRSLDGKITRTLAEIADPLAEYSTCEVVLGTVKSADGKYDNYYRLYKPVGFDPEKKYPVVVYVYGGPHSQMVQNSWLGGVRMWEMYMAQLGYVVYVQDNRGTQNRGLEFEQAIHRQCGQAEMADQMEGVKMLKTLPYVDADRIGVHGWSYGGFMTISLITNYPEVFKVAVAGGPVIDWKWYEVMYGERYMETPQSNPEGFEKVSLINKAKDLKGKLLICQGAIDNTVVWEHSLSFIRECIVNNVPVDYFPYPCAEHNVFGKDRVHLMNKVTAYFEDYL